MSTQINGLPALVSANLPAAVAISSSASAGSGVCLITTAATHLLTTGDEVSINGHLVNDAVNTQAIVTVVTGTQFTIPVGVGSVGSGGTVQSLGFGPTMPIPADGNALTAASVGPAFEALADRSAFLMQGIPINKSVSLTSHYAASTSFASWAHVDVGSMSLDIWTDIVGHGAWSLAPCLHLTDTFRISLDVNVHIAGDSGAQTLAQMALWYRASNSHVGAYGIFPGSLRMLRVEAGQNYFGSLHMSSLFLGSVGSLDVKLMCFANATIPIAWEFLGDYSIECDQLRPTGAFPS